MFKIKSFQRRILAALMGIGLVPTVLLLLFGIVLGGWAVTFVGSAGPWVSLAESGQLLLEAVEEAQVTDPAVTAAAETHQEALSESVRQSRVFELVADRFLALVPLVALALALLIGGLSYWVARQLSRGFSRPINDLIGWTELIGRSEPLPAPGPADTRGVKEFAVLREALRTMADDLEKGRREAIQAAKLRSWTEMARKVAHELKNPLGPMQMAAAKLKGSGDSEAQESAEVLLEEIGRLDEMARTFSQFGRMPEGPPSAVDILELLELLVEQHKDSGPNLTLQRVNELPLVLAHYDALLRSFRNLILNALDASGPRGEVRIMTWHEGDTVSVEIQDTGPGIPPEHLHRIWEPEFTTKSSGTGLGLPMVQLTIGAHHGRVEGRNNPEGGAVFLVELPTQGVSSQPSD